MRAISPFPVGILILLIVQMTASAASLNRECAHLLWQLNATPNDESETSLSNDAISLRYAAAEFLFRNDTKTNKISDPRAIDLFKSIADGQIKDPAKVLGAGLYDSLFTSLKSSSEFQSRLKSEEKFVAQCRENVLAAQTIIWDLPTNVNDLFVKPKPWLQSLKERVPFVEAKKMTPEEIQTSIAGLAPEKKLSTFKKTIDRGIKPITIAEAIRLTHIFAANEEATVIKLLTPSIFNNFSFYNALDAVAMLKTLNLAAAKALIKNFPVYLSASELEVFLKTVPHLSEILPVVFLADLNLSREELAKRISEASSTNLPLYVGFYAKTLLTEENDNSTEKLLVARSFSTAESEELKTIIAFVENLSVASETGEATGAPLEASFIARLNSFAAIDDARSRSNQLEAYAKEIEKISDLEFMEIYPLIPKKLNWGDLKGSLILDKAIKEHDLGDYGEKGHFVRNELLIALTLIQKINQVTDSKAFVKTYNKMMSDVKKSLGISFTNDKGESRVYNEKYKNAINNLFDAELTRILDPKRTEHVGGR